jgi:hypothetical protein
MRVRVPVQIARADANEGAIGVDLEGCQARPAAVVPLDPALLTSRSYTSDIRPGAVDCEVIAWGERHGTTDDFAARHRGEADPQQPPD